MQFKTNHSPGPFYVHNELIIDDNGQIIAESWGAKSKNICEADKKLFKTAPAMLEYMMDRAKFLYEKETAIQEEIGNGTYDAVLADIVVGNELQRILSILKDAGVEVAK